MLVVIERVRAGTRAALAYSLSPGTVAAICLIGGTTLAVAGVYHLAGIGWALVVGAFPILLFAMILIRGLTRGG